MPLTSAQKQQRRRAALDEIAAELGYDSHYKMLTALINGEAEVRKMDEVTTLEWFDDYEQAEAHAREKDLPLWDTKSAPHRYAVGHLTVEEEEDPANQEWVELV